MPSPTPNGATSAQAYAHVEYASYASWTHRMSPTIVTIVPAMASPTPPRLGMKSEPTSIAMPGTTTQRGHVTPARLMSTTRPSSKAPPTTTRITPSTRPPGVDGPRVGGGPEACGVAGGGPGGAVGFGVPAGD